MSRYHHVALSGGTTPTGERPRIKIDAKRLLAMLPKDPQGNVIVHHGPAMPSVPAGYDGSNPPQPRPQPSQPPRFARPWKRWALWGAAGLGAFALVWFFAKPKPRRTP